MGNHDFLTIGHSTHSLPQFLDLLKAHEITAIADVRSAPFSRHVPHFNRDALKPALAEVGIAYVPMGAQLGARSDDPEVHVDGRVDFERLAETKAFKTGIERLIRGRSRYRIALMCAERDPMDCHRTLLVTRALDERGQQVAHILADGALEAHAVTLQRMRRQLSLPDTDLLADEAELKRLTYRARARQITAPRR